MKMNRASSPDLILKRVRARGRGSVFTPSDFLDLAGRAAIDQALSRLVKAGQLRRLARGLYDFPKMHPKLGPLSPAPDDVARALAQETGSKVQITGARAANALGLSAQVPAQSVYLTDGPPRARCSGQTRDRSSPRVSQTSDCSREPRRYGRTSPSPSWPGRGGRRGTSCEACAYCQG